MQMILAVAVGGALGSVLRYLFARAAAAWLGTGFPYGTLGVNVLGCLAAGGLYVLLTERLAAAPEWRALLVVGFLGGFTTFSAFSVDTLRLLEESGPGPATANVVLNLTLSLLGCAAGLWLGRQVL
jgi:CrcB protein